MLITNISDILVNGLRGTVKSLEENCVNIYFYTIKKTILVKPHVFPVYNKQRKMNIGWRKQIPLNLAYGITVHRAQGMTLDKVLVDCRNMTIPGQIGVALGRASSIAGLQVLNFKTREGF